MNSTQKILADITRREFEATNSDLQTSGWKPAIANSQKRLSQLGNLIASSLETGPACKAGCSYCCHLMVEARAEEILQIADHIQSRMKADQRQAVRERITENAEKLGQMSHERQLTANLPCAFLQDGHCSIYEIRPIRCRTFHAADVSSCQKSFENPEDMEIRGTLIPELLYTGEAHVRGVRKAFEAAGYDNKVYELHMALEMALADSTPKRRYEKHKKAFTGIGQP